MESPDAGLIAIRLERISDLFESLDPAPLLDRRLSPQVKDYMATRAGELGSGPLRIELHLPAAGMDGTSGETIAAAIARAFQGAEAQELKQREELFAEGRWLLAIGAAVVVAGALAMWVIGQLVQNQFVSSLIQSVFVIIAWIIVWRPAELFLYDWLPIRQQKQLYARLAAATVVIVPRRD